MPKRLNAYGWVMPTASVMALTAVPCRPVWAKAWTAASTSALRRCAPDWRPPSAGTGEGWTGMP